MAKNCKENGQLVFLVGLIGDTGSRIFGARDAREVVRKWCEFQPDEFWDNNNTAEVETRLANTRTGDAKMWHIDATQPPAWIIERK